MRHFLMTAWLVLGAVPAAWAQISLAPQIVLLDLGDRGTTVAAVRVYNDDKTPQKVSLALEYRVPPDDVVPVGSWASVVPQELRLGPGEQRTVELRFHGQPGREGETLLSCFARVAVAAQVPLDVRVGIPVFVRWNREARVAGRLEDARYHLRDAGGLELVLKVKNDGRLHLAPYGLVWSEDRSGAKVWQAELKPGRPVFAGQRGDLTWRVDMPPAAEQGVTLGVRLFWGTLYGFDQLGAPKSVEKRLPLRLEARP